MRAGINEPAAARRSKIQQWSGPPFCQVVDRNPVIAATITLRARPYAVLRIDADGSWYDVKGGCGDSRSDLLGRGEDRAGVSACCSGRAAGRIVSFLSPPRAYQSALTMLPLSTASLMIFRCVWELLVLTQWSSTATKPRAIGPRRARTSSGEVQWCKAGSEWWAEETPTPPTAPEANETRSSVRCPWSGEGRGARRPLAAVGRLPREGVLKSRVDSSSSREQPR
jgi:hypothetical protein